MPFQEAPTTEKFKRQIGGILRDNFQIDNNLQLQERIKKGCSYFIDKLSELEEIAGLPFETGNKAVNEQIKKELESFRTDFFVKMSCLECCLAGFEIKKYLATKNKKIVEAEDIGKKKEKKPKEKREKGSSVKRTKELIDEGLTIDEITERRGMTRTTIEQHVAELVLNGEVEAKDFMSKEHYDNIVEYFEETRDASLGRARDVLGEDYSWGELRIVLNEIKKNNSV